MFFELRGSFESVHFLAENEGGSFGNITCVLGRVLEGNGLDEVMLEPGHID